VPIARLIAIALAVLVAAIGEPAFPAQATPNEPAGLEAIPPIEFYLAKGDANACGPSCSQWIAAEGKMTSGAAERLRRLLAKLGRLSLPIYFHSPGGLVAEGIAIGRLIRERNLTTSVGHTVPLACAGDKASDKACAAQKRSGQAVEAAFDQFSAMCNSACVYAFAGGTVRLIPPGVKLAIHDVGLAPSAASEPKAVIAQSKRIAHEHIEEYLHDMGIDEGLYRSALAIPFESKRFLERDELVQFGLDKREFGESPWAFVDKPTPLVLKQFFARTDNDRTRYLDGVASLGCGPWHDVRVALIRQHIASGIGSGALDSVSVSVSGQRIDLSYESSAQDFDIRVAALPPAALEHLADNEATLRLSGTDLARADEARGISLDMHGFAEAYAKLRKLCGEGIATLASGAGLGNLGPFSTLTSKVPPAPGIWMTPDSHSVKAIEDGSAAAQPAARAEPENLGPFSTRTSKMPPAPGTWMTPDSHSARATAVEPAAVQSEPTQAKCDLEIGSTPQHVTGRVIAVLSSEEGQMRTQQVEAALGAKVSTAYASLQRVEVLRYPDGHLSTMAAVPQNMSVKLGDLVELNSRYQDQSAPCSFIPWTINRLVGQAQ
jgi:hypothetical protein